MSLRIDSVGLTCGTQLSLPRRYLLRVVASMLALVAGLLSAPAGLLAAPEALEVIRITPSGDNVPPGQQIVIEFNRPVVPLGRMERDAAQLPVSISPPLNCHWRWIKRQALACNLDERDRLTASTRYTVTVTPGVLAADGATLREKAAGHFATQRPTVEHVGFKSWQHPGVPVLRVVFNQPVSRPSVARHFTLAAAGSSDPVTVSVGPDQDERQLPRYFRLPGEQWVLDSDVGSVQRSEDQRPQHDAGEEARRVWLLQPRQPLPLDTEVRLQQQAGLESALGPLRGLARSAVVAFQTYPSFRFLGIRCQRIDGRRVLLPAGAADTDVAPRCDPLAGIALAFSAPVLISDLRRSVSLDPHPGGDGKDAELWAKQQDYSRLRQAHRSGASYDYWLPGALSANQVYHLGMRREPGAKPQVLDPQVPVVLADEFNRPLEQDLDFTFNTDHRRPDFNLVHHDAVLEAAIDSEPPLYVTNLTAVTLAYRRLDQQGAQAGLAKTVAPAPVPDLAFAIPLPVRDMLQGRSGAVFGAIGSDPAVARKGQRERRFFAQVTPYQVHAKVGHFNTLVWVTDLATGEAVAGARVSVYRDVLSRLGPVPATALSAVTDQHGTATLPGTLALDPKLATLGWQCSGDDCERLLVRVDGTQGMALLPLNRSYRAASHRVSNYTVFLDQRRRYGHMSSWGLTAQGVYRAGDTVQYKLYVRDHDNEHFTAAPRQRYTLELLDPTGKVVHERKGLTLNAFGAVHGDYTLPQTSIMGWYQFRLTADFTDYQWQPMRVLVSDFTPAPFRVTNALNGDLFRPGDTLLTSTRAALHSGGAYTRAETRVTVNLRAAHFRASAPAARDFQFDTASDSRSTQLHQSVAELDGEGAAQDSLALPESDILYGRLGVESAVRDDRGQYIAATAAADYIAVDRLVGLRKNQWVFDVGAESAIDYLVVDELGQPVDDTPVTVAIERLETKAARVKAAGNAYITRFSEQWRPVDRCRGLPALAPAICTFVPDTAGRYRVIASILDTQGRSQKTTLSAWVVGSGQAVWRQDAGYALGIEPEKDSYRIGDTARFLIKNPFPGATALVTLERYGVLKQWQQRLEGSTPVLEFPVEADHVPGVYLSVVVVSPRVDEPPSADAAANSADISLDLGKPAFRMGYAAVPVTDPERALKVTASTDQATYKPRDTVRVELAAQLAQGTAASAAQGAGMPSGGQPIEYAVVVLDEAVFDLIAGGRSYFDPYQGFYTLHGLDVDNYNLLTRIVGRHRFEKKGASSGGDGGQSLSLHSLFEFVSYWNPSLAADEQGRASFEFTLPDNLTGWRVLALAVTPGDRFGLGDVNFKTNQPTELRPVMPNQVSEGDQFQAGFSVMNRTDQRRTLQVSVEVEGDAQPQPVFATRVQLDAYQRETVYLPVAAAQLALDRERPAGEITLRARAWDKRDGDALHHKLPVHKRRQLEVAAAYGSLLAEGSSPTEGFFPAEGSPLAEGSPPAEGSTSAANAVSVSIPVSVPSNIYPDAGKIAVQLAPTVIGNLEGAFRYMRDYDHRCWEQLLSRGVMASHYNQLRPRFAAGFSWPDSEQLPAQLLQQAANFQAPNGGMSYFIPEDGYVSPYLSAYTALAFNWLRAAGQQMPTSVEARLQQYLLRLLRRDELPGFYSRGMAATVRAVALNALAATGVVGEADIRRHALHLKSMDLFGAANLLAAALRTDGAADIVVQARDHLLNHANATSGKLTFNETIDDGYTRLLASPLRTQCAILSALADDGTPGAPTPVDQTAMAMVRAITQTRGNRDHWENTQENLFCMNALVDYARRWEASPPALQASVTLGEQLLGRGSFGAYTDPVLDFARPLKQGDAGNTLPLTISGEGKGRLYYASRLAYAPLAEPQERVHAGIEVRREYSVQRDGQWRLLGSQAEVRRGELLRVDLFLALPGARNFVVVDDPVPGGLEPVNRDLATASGVDAQQGHGQAAGGSWWFRHGDWVGYGASRWSFYHREIRHDAVRFYAEYLPPGRYHLSYTAQAIASGRFAADPAHASEMYDSDVYGKSLPLTLEVTEPQ